MDPDRGIIAAKPRLWPLNSHEHNRGDHPQISTALKNAPEIKTINQPSFPRADFKRQQL